MLLFTSENTIVFSLSFPVSSIVTNIIYYGTFVYHFFVIFQEYFNEIGGIPFLQLMSYYHLIL